jgi:hypothetical protein
MKANEQTDHWQFPQKNGDFSHGKENEVEAG